MDRTEQKKGALAALYAESCLEALHRIANENDANDSCFRQAAREYAFAEATAHLSHKMAMVHDLKKVIAYDKCSGLWYWHDRGDRADIHTCRTGPFEHFTEAVDDVCYPYVENSE
jgi:adenosine deaminase